MKKVRKEKIAKFDKRTLPKNVIYKLSDYMKKHKTEPPFQFYWFTNMTIFGNIVSPFLDLGKLKFKPYPRFYSLLLAISGDGRKSMSIEDGLKVFRLLSRKAQFQEGGFNFNFSTFSSSQGLGAELEPEGDDMYAPTNCIGYYDEATGLFKVVSRENEKLGKDLCSLYDSTTYFNRVKRASDSIRVYNGHLSMLMSSVVDAFQDAWQSDNTELGLGGRIMFVPGKTVFQEPFGFVQRGYESLDNIVDSLSDEILGVLYWLHQNKEPVENNNQPKLVMDIDNAAKKVFNTWYLKALRNDGSKFDDPKCKNRMDNNALRFAVLFAILDKRKVINKHDMVSAIKLMCWQYWVRKELYPVTGDNPVAVLENRIEQTLKDCSASFWKKVESNPAADDVDFWNCFITRAKVLNRHRAFIQKKGKEIRGRAWYSMSQEDIIRPIFPPECLKKRHKEPRWILDEDLKEIRKKFPGLTWKELAEGKYEEEE